MKIECKSGYLERIFRQFPRYSVIEQHSYAFFCGIGFVEKKPAFPFRGVHNFGGKYQCSFPQCKTKCVTKAALQNHVNNKHLKMHSYHTCSICEFTTYSIREYRRHVCSVKVEQMAAAASQHSIFQEPLMGKAKRGRKPKYGQSLGLGVGSALAAHHELMQTVNLTPIQTMTIKNELIFPQMNPPS